MVHALKQFGYITVNNQTSNIDENEENPTALSWLIDLSKFQHFWYFTLCSALGSYAIFFGLGGFLHVRFYKNTDQCNLLHFKYAIL